MQKLLKQSTIVLLAAALIVIPFGASTMAQVEFEVEKPSAGAMFYDLVILRPVGIVSIASCAVLWVVAFPVAAISGSVKPATQRLVVEPFRFTFPRPLGAF